MNLNYIFVLLYLCFINYAMGDFRIITKTNVDLNNHIRIMENITQITNTFKLRITSLEQKWEDKSDQIRKTIVATAQLQARKMLDNKTGPEQLCEELSKLKLEYITIKEQEEIERQEILLDYQYEMIINLDFQITDLNGYF